MTSLKTPKGMTRRHFMRHLSGASAMAVPALSMGQTVLANAQDLKKRRKSAILLWMLFGLDDGERFRGRADASSRTRTRGCRVFLPDS